MRKGLLILAAALVTLVPTSASAAARGFARGGRVVVGGWYGPYWGPYWGSYWDPFYGGFYTTNPNVGQVRLDTKLKDAQVYINGAYAGTTRENKTMYLRPGSYNIEIRGMGNARYAEKVYVAGGKTLHLRPQL